jgi:hypothetical protein
MLLVSLIIFIIMMMPIGAAKQRRNGIAEPRSGRSDEEGERLISNIRRIYYYVYVSLVLPTKR